LRPWFFEKYSENAIRQKMIESKKYGNFCVPPLVTEVTVSALYKLFPLFLEYSLVHRMENVLGWVVTFGCTRGADSLKEG
jgi:hypothetical protein